MGRTPCCDHKNGLKKGPWTSEEDQKLTDYIQNHGYGNWRTLPKNAGLQRCGKSCRLRWTNYLRPDIKRGKFSFDEEEIIIQLHSILGNKWSAIAARLPGRTDNEIKNYWNTHIRKRLLRMGIDPITHSPRLDLLDLSSILNNSSTCCFYDPNNIQTNIISRLIGNFQQVPQVNPELLRLATSLTPSHPQRDQSSNDNINNPNFIHQNSQQTQLCNSQVNPQLIQSHQPHVHQESPSPSLCDIIPFPNNEAQLLSDYPNNVELSQNSQMSSDQYWQSNGMSEEVYVPNYIQSNYFVDDYRNQNFSFSTANTTTTTTSVLSTPCSSPKPLNSNSTTYFNSCSNSTTTEDERDQSYCSNFLNFQIPDHMFDVNLEFM